MTSQQIGSIVSNFEGYMDVNNQLIESYRNHVKILYSKINDLETLLDLTEKSKEGYKELYLEALETIKRLQSEIDASRKDDSHIKA